MDSLAVSVTSGIILPKCKPWQVIRIALVLALFQAGMTLIGYMAGLGFEQYIKSYDHWIAFLLLLCLGGKMVYDSFQIEGSGDKTQDCVKISNRMLCGLGIATSIDALVVGISLAILNVPLFSLVFMVGLVTFVFSAFGVCCGSYFGEKFNLKLDLIGGLILIAIGVKILIEHLFFNN